MGFLTFMCENYDINTTDTLWQYNRVWKQREFLNVYSALLPNRTFGIIAVYHHHVGEDFNSVDCEDIYHVRVEPCFQSPQISN